MQNFIVVVHLVTSLWRHKLEPLQPLTRLASPGPLPVFRLLSAAAIIAATTPSPSGYPVTKETGHFLKFLSAGFRPTADRVSIPAAPAFRAPTPPSLVISSLSVAAIGTPTVPPPPRSPANMTFSSDTCLPFSETPGQPGDYSDDTREWTTVPDGRRIRFRRKSFRSWRHRDVTYDAIDIKFWHNGSKIVRCVCVCAKFDISAVTRYGDITGKHLGANRHLPT